MCVVFVYLYVCLGGVCGVRVRVCGVCVCGVCVCGGVCV